MTKYEQETYIYFNEEDVSTEVYTASPVTYRKLMKLCQERPDVYQLTKADRMNGEEVSWTFHISSKKLIKFWKPKVLTDEAKEMLRQRAKNELNAVDTAPKTTKNGKEEQHG